MKYSSVKTLFCVIKLTFLQLVGSSFAKGYESLVTEQYLTELIRVDLQEVKALQAVNTSLSKQRGEFQTFCFWVHFTLHSDSRFDISYLRLSQSSLALSSNYKWLLIAWCKPSYLLPINGTSRSWTFQRNAYTQTHTHTMLTPTLKNASLWRNIFFFPLPMDLPISHRLFKTFFLS